MRRIVLGVLGGVMVAQPYAAATEDGESDPASPELRALLNEEARRIREEQEPERSGNTSAEGTACRTSCALSYATLCYRVTNLCNAATVITLGGAVVPCSVARASACLGGVALATICADQCPP